MISFLVVNFQGGAFIELLLESLVRTVREETAKEVVVVDNFRAPILGEPLPKAAKETAKHFLRVALGRNASGKYGFDSPSGISVKRTRTPPLPAYWTGKMGVRGKSVSMSHAAGLWRGHLALSPDSEFVGLLDQDVVFLKKGWLGELLGKFRDDPDLVLAGAFRDVKIYARPFLRPFCLVYRRSFYSGFGDVYRPTPSGDTCSALTYLCEENGKRLHLCRNSADTPDLGGGLDAKKSGHFAVDDAGDVFVVHKGHGTELDDKSWIFAMRERVRALG